MVGILVRPKRFELLHPIRKLPVLTYDQYGNQEGLTNERLMWISDLCT